MKSYLYGGLLAGLCLFASHSFAQTTLSDFEGPSADSWTGTTATDTHFPNGFTAASGVDDSGNGVLNLSDGGFGGGAMRTYTVTPDSLVVVRALGRIVTDPGSLTADTASPFGTSLGIADGATGLVDQDFSWSRSLATSVDDSGQAFMEIVAAGPANSGNLTVFLTPDADDGSVGSGAWTVQLDEIVLNTVGAGSVLSDFAAGTDGWASITAANSWSAGSAFSTFTNPVDAVSSSEVLAVNDGGFTGGAFRTYTAALPAAGVHVVSVDVRVETDGSLERARIGAVAGGTTTNIGDVSWSRSFTTTADDSGQAAFQTVSCAVVSSGASDLTVYLAADYDFAAGAGATQIHLDNVTLTTGLVVPVELSSFDLE